MGNSNRPCKVSKKRTIKKKYRKDKHGIKPGTRPYKKKRKYTKRKSTKKSNKKSSKKGGNFQIKRNGARKLPSRRPFLSGVGPRAHRGRLPPGIGVSADRSTKTQRDRLEKIVEYFARAHSTALTQKQEKDKISEIKKQYEGSLKELCWFLGIDTDRCTARKISPMINETGRDLLLNSLEINSEREGGRRKGEATGQTDGQTEIRAPATLN